MPRTTVILSDQDASALQRASRAEGLSQAELIRRGVRAVTAAYRSRPRVEVGWLELTKSERKEIAGGSFGDRDER
jgi:hypothetical protein